MGYIIDPDCLACVKCYRVIASVGTGQAHLVDEGRGGVCCDECRSDEAPTPPGPQPGTPQRREPSLRRHPAEVTAMRLLGHYERWYNRLDGDQLDAISKAWHALRRIAEEDEG